MKKNISAFLFLTVFATATIQAQTISEDDLPFTFLSWHYNFYPGAEENQWTKLEKNGEERLFVDFQFEGRNLAVTYKTNGRRVKARTKYSEKEVPDLVTGFLTEQFEKFKIDEFMKTDVYDGPKVSDFFYSARVRVKKENHVLYFDKELNHVLNPEVQLLSSAR
ncbi:MAG: hypothetical protein R8G66_26880 [Cytophagales bacterium]|nr:hypothetical protein [Cytophagales bacterium]